MFCCTLRLSEIGHKMTLFGLLVREYRRQLEGVLRLQDLSLSAFIGNIKLREVFISLSLMKRKSNIASTPTTPKLLSFIDLHPESLLLLCKS
uniref:Uncharacterized protein n=1 Tax=Megaselia scalaris TaxID=36166 RepID=T1H5H4_MEGSC